MTTINGVVDRLSKISPVLTWLIMVLLITSSNIISASIYVKPKIPSILTPMIHSFIPEAGYIGSEITILGKYFNLVTPSIDKVTFNGFPATDYTVNSDAEILVRIPPNAITGKISISSSAWNTTSENDFIILQNFPTITSFQPAAGVVGTKVIIIGKNLNLFNPSKDLLTFNESVPSDFKIDSESQITVNAVPKGATSGKIKLSSNLGTAISSRDFIVTKIPPPKVPSIYKFTPPSGLIGSKVTIEGDNFDKLIPGMDNILFNGTPTTTFLVKYDTEISVSVPENATSGKIMLTSKNGSAISREDFIIEKPPPPPKPKILVLIPDTEFFRNNIRPITLELDKLNKINNSNKEYNYYLVDIQGEREWNLNNANPPSVRSPYSNDKIKSSLIDTYKVRSLLITKNKQTSTSTVTLWFSNINPDNQSGITFSDIPEISGRNLFVWYGNPSESTKLEKFVGKENLINLKNDLTPLANSVNEVIRSKNWLGN